MSDHSFRRRRQTYPSESSGNSPQLELVHYPKDWKVILHNAPGGQLVLYNKQDKKLAVQRGARQRSLPTPDPGMCMLCHRPYETERDPDYTNSFMDANYFQLLAAASTPPSDEESSDIGEPATSAPVFVDSQSHLSANSFNQGYYRRFFIEEKKLGRGFRGSVFLCQHVLDNVYLGQYAVKKVAIGDNHEWLTRMLKEVHLLETLHHMNIIDYKHAWLENHCLNNFGPDVPCLFILMECANGGNLEEYINQMDESMDTPQHKPLNLKEQLIAERNRKRSLRDRGVGIRGGSPAFGARAASNPQNVRLLTLEEIWSFFKDICEGLAHLHRNGIIHRDLKPPNLLLNYSNGEAKSGIPKILLSDFGECEILTQLVNRDRTGATGTMEFMAPELLQVDSQGHYIKDYSPKADMWSLGMLLYYLCYSRLPYHNIEDVDLLKQEVLGLQKIEFPNKYPDFVRDDIPHQLHDLIRQLLSLNPRRRPSIDDILDQWTIHGSFVPQNQTEINAARSDARRQETPQITRIPSDADIAQTMAKKLTKHQRRPDKARFEKITNASETESDSDITAKLRLLPDREEKLYTILNFLKAPMNAKILVAILKHNAVLPSILAESDNFLPDSCLFFVGFLFQEFHSKWETCCITYNPTRRG
ncbi:kinase-like protein [Basidiobolus meristosporus CBS 931.73]|uniref:non-specific serine/threonine protein kinase n=1 Tax=Basidiobolus meristosporus CBS 931.73 TaxID=1314790 RepID=A0A1Y1Z7R7_9FUNG|nr:kinase-like protein [Basidiobolus meristosporus CBS 931.73]|eukprot:ORY06293.1 kinase-like protein [Basidiobolus meristosporus CBS 931.73]